jgi:hypothetical protein
MRRMLSFTFTMLITIPCIIAIGVTTQAAGAADSSPDRTTVVGCLTSPQASQEKSGWSTPVTSFVVTNTGSETSGVIPTAGTDKSDSDSTGYRLDVTSFLFKASGDYDRLYPIEYKRLYPDLGHKIQVVGTVRAQKNGVASDVGSAGSALEMPELKVESIKVLSATCSQ